MRYFEDKNGVWHKWGNRTRTSEYTVYLVSECGKAEKPVGITPKWAVNTSDEYGTPRCELCFP